MSVVGSPLNTLGANIPSIGTDGAGYLYNDITLPDDNDKLVRGEITREPTLGILYLNADSSFRYVGATDYFEYQLYVDDIPTGSPTRVDLTTLVVNFGLILSSNTSLSSITNKAFTRKIHIEGKLLNRIKYVVQLY